MTERENMQQLPDDLAEAGARLRENRHAAASLELDELKRRAMAQASRASRRPHRGLALRSRVVTVMMLAGLSLSAASAGVIAGTSTSGSSPSASISQYVLAEAIAPSSARLVAPRGCPRAPYLARVTGQNIARVVFRLDGRVIKTVKRPDRQGRWGVRINPLRFSVGVHVLTSRVTFKPAAKKNPRTLRVELRRCARKAAAPKFTG